MWEDAITYLKGEAPRVKDKIKQNREKIIHKVVSDRVEKYFAKGKQVFKDTTTHVKGKSPGVKDKIKQNREKIIHKVVSDRVEKYFAKGKQVFKDTATHVKGKSPGVKDKIKPAWEKAEQNIRGDEKIFYDYRGIVGTDDFDEAVALLLTHFDSPFSKSECLEECKEYPHLLFDPRAVQFAHLDCPPLCKEALARAIDYEEVNYFPADFDTPLLLRYREY
ncbi:hypothetical protein RRG08_000430 [Elysia crispata]|uniref:Uncharacterized protein n=1 Tax=Elysia crispata TaxID=231223 RepID=A0AAE1CW00_9GAST|nr:hypothetical protein RRG08_000430 [Elysia crispata]